MTGAFATAVHVLGRRLTAAQRAILIALAEEADPTAGVHANVCGLAHRTGYSIRRVRETLDELVAGGWIVPGGAR